MESISALHESFCYRLACHSPVAKDSLHAGLNHLKDWIYCWLNKKSCGGTLFNEKQNIPQMFSDTEMAEA